MNLITQKDRRQMPVLGYVISALVAIVTVLGGLIGSGIVNALHDLTAEVRVVASRLSVVETLLGNERERQTGDEQDQNKIRQELTIQHDQIQTLMMQRQIFGHRQHTNDEQQSANNKEQAINDNNQRRSQ